MKQEDRYKYFAGMRMRGISKILAWILAVTIVFMATYALILPAITIDADTAAQEPGFVLETDSQEAVPTTELSEGEKDPEDPISDPGDLTGDTDGEQAEAEDNQEPISNPEGPENKEPADTETDAEASVALAGDIAAPETDVEIAETDPEATETNGGNAEIAKAAPDGDAQDGETLGEDNPDGDTQATDAENPEDISDKTVSDETPAVDPVQEDETESVVQPDYLSGTLVYEEGNDYTVTAVARTDAEIPADADFIVTEITDEETYAFYYQKALEALGEAELGFARFFDIRFEKNGAEIEPQAPVDISIRYAEPVEATEDQLAAIHFHEEGTADEETAATGTEAADPEPTVTADVLETSMDAVADNCEISFTAETFSVFGIVGTTIEKTVLASDGHNYKISVTYGPEAGVPEGAELEVSEILQGEDSSYEPTEYDIYLEKTREALGLETGLFGYARFFDIKIVDENGAKVEIAAPVDVKIELTDKESGEEAADTTQVVHFADGSESGDVVKITTETAEAGQAVFFEAEGFSVYAIVTPTTVGELNGKEFALITWDGGQTGKGLTGDLHQDIEGNLCAEFLTVMTKMSGKKQLQLFVPNNSDEQVTTWKFEQQQGNIFKLKAKIYSRSDDGNQISAGEKYLKIGRDGKLSMVNDVSEASEIQVNLQTSGVHKGQICLKCNGKTLTYSGEFANGFNTSGATGNEWLYLAETKPESELVGYQRTYTAEKISVSDPSLTPLFDGDTKKVIIYTRVWNGSGYTYFAINGNGELVRCSESGNEIEWKGSGLDELQWKFTEYGEWTTVYQKDDEGNLITDADGKPKPVLLTDKDGTPVYETDAQGNYVLDDNGNKIQRIKRVITPNYYYELQNAYTGKYLAPLISANQILSSDTVGLNMNGRRNGQYYTSILAWDGENYSYASIEADLDASASAGAAIYPCARVDGMDLYFAIINDLEADDALHTVPTVDNNMYGITMRMANYYNYIKGKNCDTSKEQHDILGASNYTPNQTSGLLSTNLGSDGYPIATNSRQSLGVLYTAIDDGTHKITVNENVNHLFVESTYKATGYYEYDSSQNYAYLQSNGDFIVYQELGAHDYGNEKPTLKHGQFLPYNNLQAGHFAVKNGRNLYTPTGAALDPSDPRYNEQLYLADYTGQHPDFCFGMELTAGFYQTPSGLDAWGHDIIFEFSGDDDFWLYVDGELVIDLGGIHSALPASVNFRTGEVKVNGVTKSLRQVFIDNYIARGKDPSEAEKIFTTKYDEELGRDVTTFKDNGYHEMRIFYMERGWSASNLHMKFNLAAVEKGTVQLSKELDVGDEDMSDSVLATFPYQIWYKDPLYNEQSTDHNEEYVQLTEEKLGNRGSVKYLDSNKEVEYKREIYVDNTYIDRNGQAVQCSVKYEGVCLVDPGETVVITFPVFGETGEEQFVTEYKIVECGIDPNIYPNVTLDDGKVPNPVPVNTSIRVTERDPKTGLPTATGIGSPTVNGSETNDAVYSGLCNYEIEYDSPDNRSRVKYKNKVEETEELLIQKNLYKKEGTNDPELIPKSEYYYDNGKPLDPDNPDLKTTYDFRVSFKTPYDEDYTPANVYQYHVKDAGGYYCKWHPADTSSSNPNEESSQGYFERITNETYPDGVTDFDLLTPDTIVNGKVVHGEQFAATFDTSINGAISQIPAYYTVELQGLIPGTQFKVVERPNETPEGYEFYRYELDGKPVVPYSNVSDISVGDNRVTAANFASRRSKLYTKTAAGEYHPLSDGDTFNPNETYYEVDPWIGVEGTIVKDKESEVLVDNYKGYALHLYKTWTDASTMANRNPAYFAVYYETKNQNGEISRTLMADSVRRLQYKDDPQELYWFYLHLPPVTDVINPVFENYVVREVALTGDDITVNDEGTVIGYQTIEVIENGCNVTIQGLSNSQGAEWKNTAYKVTYTKTQTVGTSLRKFWVTDTPTDRPAVKFLKEDWSGNPLAGAKFTLTQGNTTIFSNKVSVKTESSNQAVISIEHLTEDTNYVLKETLAPQGYYGLQEDLTFQLVTSGDGIGWTLNVTSNTGDIKDYYHVGSEQVTETIDGQEVVTDYVTLTIKDRHYDFVVIKEDGITHNGLNGVKFTLHRQYTVDDLTDYGLAIVWDQSSELITKKINGINGVIPHIDNQLPAGTYQLREKTAASGYQKTGNIDFTIDELGVITLGNNHPDDVTLSKTTNENDNVVYTITIPNTPLPLKLLKKDISGADLLGAKFKLYQKIDSHFNVVEGYKDIDLTETNSIDLSNLPPNIYWLEEVKQPEGYIITQKDIYFKIENDRTVKLCDCNGANIANNSVVELSGKKANGYTITIKNTPGAELPETGGTTPIPLYIIGSVLLFGAACGLIMKRKKR